MERRTRNIRLLIAAATMAGAFAVPWSSSESVELAAESNQVLDNGIWHPTQP